MWFQLLFIILIFVLKINCYYLYNEKNHQVITYPSLNNIPKGFKILRAPKYLKTKKDASSLNLSCQNSNFFCTEPYNRSLTYQFECEFDHQCPRYYKCCPDKCFVHKICSRGIPIQTTINNNNKKNSTTNNHKFGLNGTKKRPDDHKNDGQCEKWLYPCSTPYSYGFSYQFKCDHDRQCPKGYLCCQQDCFIHKICSKKVTNKQYVEELRNKDQPNVKNSKKATTSRYLETTPYDVDEEIRDNTKKLYEVNNVVYFDNFSTEKTDELSEEESDESEETTEEKTTEEETTEEETTEKESTETTEEETVTATTAEITDTSVSTLDPNAIDPNYDEYYHQEYDTSDESDD